MGFVAEAMAQIKLGDYKSAASILSENIEDPSLKPTAKIDIMEWIADCNLKSEGEEAAAAKWFEAAARASFECKDLSQVERKAKALVDFERALEACKKGNDLEGIRRITKLKLSLTSNVR